MDGEQADSAAFQRRLRQEALLKEYELCEQGARGTANWIWASTAVFLGAWITALGIVAANVEKDQVRALLWHLAWTAVAAQVIWFTFLERSLRVRQRLFVRQRQIEFQGVGMLKSIGMDLADNPERLGDYRQRLNGFLELQQELDAFARELQTIRRGWLEAAIGQVSDCLYAIVGLGRAGRGALYLLSILVIVAWIILAIKVNA